MKSHPLLCQTSMVSALLAGTKTQTRRLKGLKKLNAYQESAGYESSVYQKMLREIKPHVKVGDLFWVRESWAETCDGAGSPIVAYKTGMPQYIGTHEGQNRLLGNCENEWSINNYPAGGKWKSPLFMPKWASRITLEVTDVQMERLQEITEQEAIAEGVEVDSFKSSVFKSYEGYKNYLYQDWDDYTLFKKAVDSYRSLWIALHGQESWEQNPFVWVYSFRVMPR